MPKSVAAFWIDLLSHLKGGRNFAFFIPPMGSWGSWRSSVPLSRLGWRSGGRPVHLASGAEILGHIENWMFTAHRRYFSFLPALLFSLYNYAVLSDISGMFETSPDMTLELLGFL